MQLRYRRLTLRPCFELSYRGAGSRNHREPDLYTSQEITSWLKGKVNHQTSIQHSRGRYSLGIRAIAELSDWLRETYGDPAEGDSILNSCSFKASKSIECKDLVLTVSWLGKMEALFVLSVNSSIFLGGVCRGGSVNSQIVSRQLQPRVRV